MRVGGGGDARAALARLLLLAARHRSTRRKLFHVPDRASPLRRKRMDWLVRCGQLDAEQFRRRYRMSKPSFAKLSLALKGKLGLHRREVGRDLQISITLRLLCGGSCCDIDDLHGTAQSTSRKCFLRTLHAIDDTLDMSLDVRDTERLEALAAQFAARSEGVLTGIIGALDGVHVRIRKPRSAGAGYYCRKGCAQSMSRLPLWLCQMTQVVAVEQVLLGQRPVRCCC